MFCIPIHLREIGIHELTALCSQYEVALGGLRRTSVVHRTLGSEANLKSGAQRI